MLSTRHARKRTRALHEVAELGGILLDHDHGLVIDTRRVVAVQPLLFRILDLDRLGRLVGVKGVAQTVEAHAGEVGGGVGRARNDLARARDDHDVVDREQLTILRHLGIGRLKAGVVLRHEGNARRLRLVDGVELCRVLHGLGIRLLEKLGQRCLLVLDLLGIARTRELALHAGEQHAHGDHAGKDNGDKNADPYGESLGHSHLLPPSPTYR